MSRFLMFFLALACFATEYFEAPFLLECDGVGEKSQVFFMRNPESVGLKTCVIDQRERAAYIAIEDLKGNCFDCDVNLFRVLQCSWVFSFDFNEKTLGDVYSQSECDSAMCLSVRDQDGIVVGGSQSENIVPAVNPVNRLLCDFRAESLTVFKFLAHCPDGRMLFASAKVRYEDLKNVETGCGKGSLNSVESPDVVGTLCFKDKTDEVA